MKKAQAIVSIGLAALFIIATIFVVSSTGGSEPVSVGYAGQYSVKAETDDSLININTADLDALCTLPGVGEATARKIIAYREEHGPFSGVAGIVDVKGVGLKTFEAFKDKITV